MRIIKQNFKVMMFFFLALGALKTENAKGQLANSNNNDGDIVVKSSNTRGGGKTILNNYSNSVNETPFNIYPNPTNDVATISYKLESDTKTGISIYNTMGQKVAQVEAYGKKAKGNYKLEYNTSNLVAGIYYCTLENANFVKSIKIVKTE